MFRIKYLIILFLFIFFSSTAYSAVYYDKDGNKNDTNVDRFKAQQGLNIKESSVANWMENSTKNAMNKSKKNKKEYNRQDNRTRTYQKSYKWF